MERIVRDLVVSMHHVFSSDGDRIVFSSNRGGNMDLLTMKVDGMDMIQLTDDAYQDNFPKKIQE